MKMNKSGNNCIVSVLMTSYNHEQYLAMALDSVLSQKTRFQFEIIIHDDASKDKSVEIIEEYTRRYPSIIRAIIQTENQYSKGVNYFTRFMLPLVKGKYMAYCECDDYWTDENKLQKQVDFLETHNEFYGTAHNCDYVNEDSDVIEALYRSLYGPFKEHNHTLSYYAYYPSIYPGQSATVLHRTSVFLEMDAECMNAFAKVRSNGDVKRNLVILLNGPIRFFEDKMSCYRIVSRKGDSWTARMRNKNQSWLIFIGHRDLRKFSKEYYNVRLRNYYSMFHAGSAGLIKFLMNKSKENRNVFESINEETGGVVSLMIVLVFYGIMSIPTCISRLLKLQNRLYYPETLPTKQAQQYEA